MQEKLISLWTRFLRCESGVTLVEYGVAVALAIFVGAATFAVLADNVTDAMNAAGSVMVD